MANLIQPTAVLTLYFLPPQEPVPSGEQDEGQDMGIEVEELEYGGFHLSLEEAISAMAVSPGDLTLAVGTLDDEICVVDTGKGEIAYKLDGHAGGVNSLSYLTEKLLASAGEDGTVRLSLEAVKPQLVQ